jgi:hypothetical protein
MENPKHRVFCENIVFFQVPAISRVLEASGGHMCSPSVHVTAFQSPNRCYTMDATWANHNSSGIYSTMAAGKIPQQKMAFA